MNATASGGTGPSNGGPAYHTFHTAIKAFDATTKWLVIAAMAVMTVLVLSQIVARYAFSSGLDWSEEVARLAFVWAMFLAIPHGIRSGVHVGIDAVVVMLPEPWQEALFRLSAILGAVLMIAIFWYSAEVTLYTWPEKMPTLNFTASVYYIAILFAAAHSFLHLCLLAWGGRNTWPRERMT